MSGKKSNDTKCDKGFGPSYGSCCCNCRHHVKLYKHSWNGEPFKGSMSEHTGLYACIVFHIVDKDGMAVIYDKEHGMCEMHDWAKDKK